ncbi:KinB-signaling pathway activation protein [Bacillus gobiensis]|uniref:KinB-signaling pathway activation protein n=1 Tax=Bacillus gobiensis TaxID=1441095 RepID=UPI003D1F0F71
MKSRGIVKLFFSTLGIGAVITIIIGFALQWERYQELFVSFDVLEILSVAFWFMGVGFIFSVISQMGFVVYLTIHRFALEILKSFSLWNSIQVVLILFVLFDLVYLRYIAFGNGESVVPFLWLPLFILLFGAAVAYTKHQQSSKNTFVSALFLMVVISVIEWFPALRVNEESWLYLMLFPLLGCNAYQLLVLPRFIEKKKEKSTAAM